ncbi:hypothetical protein [Flavobacterium sp.]|uniref:hypothetical protein n=1 Tax=Flavobacterium sp. TaxID=239 RepID=UPI0039E5474C
MKTKIFRTTLLALLVTNLFASCESCQKKENTIPAYSTTDSKEKEMDTTTTDQAQATDESTANTVQNSPAGKKTVPSKSNVQGQSGYSAPDGTDAENHDGDQYTKNDDKPMPSGPPIK